MSEQYSTLPQKNSDKVSLQDFIKNSYSNALNRVQDGVTYIRDEISEMYQHSGYYMNQMVLPVNNFLKDLTQIDTELSQETGNQSTHFLSLDGQLIPAEQVLNRPMEENY